METSPLVAGAEVAWRASDVRVPAAPGRPALRMAWRECGPPRAPAVLCVHGLTRHGHDFDALAEALAHEWRVLTPDLPGRGDSQWCARPEHYGDALYLEALEALLVEAVGEPVHWVGTSLGAALGMRMAQRRPRWVRSLVMNDSGPQVDGAALRALRDGARERPGFASMAQARAYLRQRYAEFGLETEADWRALELHAMQRETDGLLRMRFDPYVVSDAPVPDTIDLWPLWQEVRCPVLVLRGERSRILSRETCERMVQGRADARWIEFAGVGHAPHLAGAARIGPIAGFLRAAGASPSPSTRSLP